jgi:hypothetical protein
VGLPANPESRFELAKSLSFNSAIAEQIKQKEESQVAKQNKQEVVKSEAPIEPIVEQPKEQVAPEVKQEEVVEAPEAQENVVEEPKKDEAALVDNEVEKPVEENVEESKKEEVVAEDKKEEVKPEEVVEEPKQEEAVVEAPKVSEEVVEKSEVVEKAKTDETPSETVEEKPEPELEKTDVEKAEWTTEYINTLPNSSFAVIEPAYLEGKTEDKNARHLPFKDENGEVDLPHYRNALARVNQIKPITDSISEEELRSKAAAELEKYRDLLEENKSEKSTEEKILDALALIIEKLSALDKKEVTEKKDEVVVEPKKEEKALEVAEESKQEEIVVEKTVEKVVEKKEETPTRKSLAIVVPSPYEEETKETNPKEEERTKNVGWSKLIFGK